MVEEALTKAALWGEVKDKLKQSAFGLSGGQQQRLCISRTIAVHPDVFLMDEPCSKCRVDSRGIRVTVQRLRQKLALTAPEVYPIVETVRGVGYRIFS